MKVFIFLLISVTANAQMQKPSLEEASAKINKSLPEIYDHATKLMKTTVENNNINYHFIIGATKDEYARAFPKVKAQILSTICSKPQERALLRDYNANIVYRYESHKGISLGEFMVRPEHCQKK